MVIVLSLFLHLVREQLAWQRRLYIIFASFEKHLKLCVFVSLCVLALV